MHGRLTVLLIKKQKMQKHLLIGVPAHIRFIFLLFTPPPPLPTPQPPSSSINLPPLLSVCVITAFFAVIFSQHINNNYMPKFTWLAWLQAVIPWCIVESMKLSHGCYLWKSTGACFFVKTSVWFTCIWTPSSVWRGNAVMSPQLASERVVRFCASVLILFC